MTTLFSYIPDQGATEIREPRRRVIQFGDGYRQTAASGINADLGKWDLTFGVRSAAESQAMMDLFRVDGGGGTVPLAWVPPGEVAAIRVLAWPYKRSQVGPDNFTVQVTFEEVP